MITMENWNGDFKKVATPGAEISEEVFDHFLGVVPPVRQNPRGFLCGEPVDHRGIDGAARYFAFKQHNNRFFMLG